MGIVTRTGAGRTTELTWAELDENFNWLASQVASARLKDNIITSLGTELIALNVGYLGGQNRAYFQRPVGEIIWTATPVCPTNFLICNGASVSATTYNALFSALTRVVGTAGTSGTNFIIPAHGLVIGDKVTVVGTGGLPEGVDHYVLAAGWTTGQFRLSTNPIAADGTSSGSVTIYHTPFGRSGSTANFNLPNMLGAFPRGVNNTYTGVNNISSGIDINRPLGSIQLPANQVHHHDITDPGHAHGLDRQQNTGGPARFGIRDAANLDQTGATASNTTGITNTDNEGTEARPYNVALLPCIRCF